MDFLALKGEDILRKKNFKISKLPTFIFYRPRLTGKSLSFFSGCQVAWILGDNWDQLHTPPRLLPFQAFSIFAFKTSDDG